ncbi:S-adenosyl-L-methionine-dependent methyltransferase [Dichotomocladium elegans]|nr:S-adenosyl-L-methionine-dependent methyltransferase [Dichotomocladium elegans]
MSRSPWYLRFLPLSNKPKRSSSSSTREKNEPIPTPSQSETLQSLHIYSLGRRYHNRADVPSVLPDDDEEHERIHRQHWTLKYAFGNNYLSPIKNQLEQGITVLDSGCGPATWVLEMANEYPNSRFHGTDVSSGFPDMIKPKNCTFHVHNILEPLPFPEQSFDFVHQRLLILGLLASDWERTLDSLIRVLKPGGWIEVVEVGFADYQNAGPMCDTVIDASRILFSERNMDINIGKKLGKMLGKAGMINVHTVPVPVPLNHGGKVGQLTWEDYRDIFTALKPFVYKTHPIFNEEFVRQFGEECKQNKTHMIWYRNYAQKPL